MKFLVTGGAGFLGATLANQLAKEGHTVCALDDLSNGNTATLHPDVAFKQGDVNNIPLLWSLLHLSNGNTATLHPDVAFKQGDVNNRSGLCVSFSGTGFCRPIDAAPT